MRALFLVVGLLAGCSGLKMESDCSYTREVKTAYICKNDGKVEHYKLDYEQ